MQQPKVLVFDIETSPLQVYAWGLGEQYVGTEQIIKEWHVLCWAAKWLDAPESSLIYRETRTGNDREILKPMWKLLDEADIVVTQNGKKFDSRKLNARFISNGFPPPSPYKHHDTYRISKEAAEFTSHKLEYLTDKLNRKFKKLDHGRYPGLSLWKRCLAGDKEAWKDMKEYNIHDVLSTEEFYKIIRPWAPQNAPKVYHGDTCRMCNGKVQKRGFMWKSKTQVQRIQCVSCGAWDTVAIKKEKAA